LKVAACRVQAFAASRVSPCGGPGAGPPAPGPGHGARRTLPEALATWLLGAPLPAYRGQAGGLTGELLARLAPGDTLVLGGVGSLTAPSAWLARLVPGAGAASFGELGGALRATVMLGRRHDGDVVLTLWLETAQSAALGAAAGVRSALALGGTEMGFKLGAEAAAGPETGQVALVRFRFAPRDHADMARLRDLVEGAAGRLALPGEVGGAFGTALGRAFAHNFHEASYGVSAGWVGGATATAGRTAETGGRVKAKAGVAGHFGGERYRTFHRDGSVTDTRMSFEGGERGLKVARLAAGKVQEREVSVLNVTRDAGGALVGLSAEFLDVSGRRGVLGVPYALLGARGVRKRNEIVSLNAAGLAAARSLLAGGLSEDETFRVLAADPAKVEISRVDLAGEFGTLGFDLGAAIGSSRAGLTAMATAGRIRRTGGKGGEASMREMQDLMRSRVSRARG